MRSNTQKTQPELVLLKTKSCWEEEAHPEPGSDPPVGQAQSMSKLREEGRDDRRMRGNNGSPTPCWISVCSGHRLLCNKHQCHLLFVLSAPFFWQQHAPCDSSSRDGSWFSPLRLPTILHPALPSSGGSRLVAHIPGISDWLASVWDLQQVEGKRRERVGYLCPTSSLFCGGPAPP